MARPDIIAGNPITWYLMRHEEGQNDIKQYLLTVTTGCNMDIWGLFPRTRVYGRVVIPIISPHLNTDYNKGQRMHQK